jgi:hypothetical protein
MAASHGRFTRLIRGGRWHKQRQAASNQPATRRRARQSGATQSRVARPRCWRHVTPVCTALHSAIAHRRRRSCHPAGNLQVQGRRLVLSLSRAPFRAPALSRPFSLCLFSPSAPFLAGGLSPLGVGGVGGCAGPVQPVRARMCCCWPGRDPLALAGGFGAVGVGRRGRRRVAIMSGRDWPEKDGFAGLPPTDLTDYCGQSARSSALRIGQLTHCRAGKSLYRPLIDRVRYVPGFVDVLVYHSLCSCDACHACRQRDRSIAVL